MSRGEHYFSGDSESHPFAHFKHQSFVNISFSSHDPAARVVFRARGRPSVRGCVFFSLLCGASAPRRAPRERWRALAAGSAALSPNVEQGAAAQPTKGLAETLREPVTGTRHSCVGGRRKGERDGEGLQREEYKAVLLLLPQCWITRADGRLAAAFAPENRPLISPTVEC